MRTNAVLVFLALGLCLWSASGLAAYQTITNDVWWLDNNGKPIMAQGGGISKFGNTYYWYGVQYAEMGPYFTNGTVNSSSSTFVAINCYSSTDLVHWTFQNQVVNKSTSGFSTPGWVGRLGQVAYNSADNQYVMWFEGLGGQACCTCSTPTGNFVLNHVQDTITNVYYGPGAGDCTIFCDVDHGGTPYFICSDPHGRQHAYVCPLGSNYLIIGNAVAINDTDGVPAWPQGQEANNMFERNGIYYYTMSNLAGWSYSTAYEVNSTSIFSPTSYTADAPYLGTTADDTHYSQVSFGFQVAGTEATNYIMVGDRWSQFDSTYTSAGHGKNFAIMCPITFSNGTPYFNSESMFQVDTVTGNIRPATPAGAPTNLTATASQGLAPGQVALIWAAIDGATAYNVYRSTTNGGPYASIANSTANTYTDTGLQNGTTYYYVVTSTNLFGESSASAQVNATPSIGPIINTASASPSPVYPDGTLTISATVTAQANPIAWVTVNVSALGGATNQTLISDGVGGYTNTIVVGADALAGAQSLVINAADDLGNVASPYLFSVTVGSEDFTWDGVGSDENWGDGANWVGGVAPGPGSTLDFTGGNGLAPVMNNSYNIYTILFDNNAGAFTIGSTGSSTLTLTGGVTNNSAHTQALNVPVLLGAPVTFNASSAGLSLEQPINNSTNQLTITDSGFDTTIDAAISGTGGLAYLGAATNTLLGANTFTGNLSISNGTLVIGGAGQLGGGAYSGAISDNGMLACDSTARQILSGVISGTGALEQNGLGQLALFAINTFTGPATVESGTLLVSNEYALQNNTLACNGGDVTFGGITDAAFGALAGSEGLALVNLAGVPIALTVGGNNVSTAYSGALSGAGSLAKGGTGTLTLSGANTYAGNTTILGGNLIVSGGTINAPGSTITVGNGSTGISLSVTGGMVIAGTLDVAPVGGSTGDNASITGSASAAFSAVNLGGSGNTSGPLTINTTASVSLGTLIDYKDLEGTGPSTTSGLIIDQGTVTASSIIIQDTASCADLNINGGSLTIGNSASNGAFEIGNGDSTRGGWLTMTGGSLTYLGTDGLLMNTVSGSVNGANLIGAGAVATLTGITLNRINAAGATSWLVVSNGATLYFGQVGLVMNQPGSDVFASLGPATLGAFTNWSSSAPITLAGATTFQAADASGAAHNITLNGALSGAGSLVKTGGGTLTLNGTNSYGATTVNGGTLAGTGSIAGASPSIPVACCLRGILWAP